MGEERFWAIACLFSQMWWGLSAFYFTVFLLLLSPYSDQLSDLGPTSDILLALGLMAGLTLYVAVGCTRRKRSGEVKTDTSLLDQIRGND